MDLKTEKALTRNNMLNNMLSNLNFAPFLLAFFLRTGRYKTTTGTRTWIFSSTLYTCILVSGFGKKNIIFTLKCIWKAGGKKNVLENKSILLFVSLLPFFQSVTGISFAYLQLSNRYCRTGTTNNAFMGFLFFNLNG